jgi:hypothetical protein
MIPMEFDMGIEVLETLVEVRLPTPDTFLKVKETLTRIGVTSADDTRLYPSCHVFHKQGKYWIVHFKSMLEVDGGHANMSAEDWVRYYTIVKLLNDWGLVELVDPMQLAGKEVNPGKVKIVPYKDKAKWTIIPKYTMSSNKKT